MSPNKKNHTQQADNRIDQIHGVLDIIVSVLSPLRLEQNMYSGLKIWADSICLELFQNTPDFEDQLVIRLNNRRLYGFAQDIVLASIPAPNDATVIIEGRLYVAPQKKEDSRVVKKARVKTLPEQGKLLQGDDFVLDPSISTLWRIGRGKQVMVNNLLRKNDIAIDGDDNNVEEIFLRQVSSHHAHIEYSKGAFFLVSDNTQVNTRILRSGFYEPFEVNAQRELKDKDQIILGDFITLVFEVL